MNRGVVAAAAALALMGAATARAGLFDDEEARKAIVDMRNRIAQTDESAKTRAAELAAQNQQLGELIQGVRRSLLDLNNQIEAIRADMAKLRGADEQIARDVSEMQKRQRDIAQNLDDRLRKLEPVKASVDGVEFLAEPDEKRMYEEAIGAVRGGDFEKASAAMAMFLRRYPGSGYLDSARYWLAQSLYGKRDYKEAMAMFRLFVSGAPQHPRAAEALLSIANSQVESKDKVGARKTIDELMKTYPGTDAAAAGKERLASIK